MYVCMYACVLQVMRRLLRMLVALGLYHDRFEVPFLADRSLTQSLFHSVTQSQVLTQSLTHFPCLSPLARFLPLLLTCHS